MQRMDDVDDMIAHLTACPVGTTVPNSNRHIRQANATAILIVAVLRFDFDQVTAIWLAQLKFASEIVWINATK